MRSIIFCTFADAEGSATINGREYRWGYHEYLGPTFLKKDGTPLARQPGEKHPVWDAFDAWLKAYKIKKGNE
jgi:hypothetical protein